ncbi:MAG: Ig-like domain-containing protein, partial [Candidatus Coproplasma sp.]
MDKKLIRRIVAVVMTCASISALAFIGCNTKPATPNNPGGSEVETPGEESVSLNKTSASITVGGYVILSASVTPNTVSQTVTWTTSDPNVATVENGYVTGAGVGTATITATSVGGKTATCTVTVTAADSVNVPVTGVTLNNSELTLRPNGTATLVATVAPSNATIKTVTWSSSNTAVATVADGVVTAVAEGTATITVTTEDGSKTATCAVTVQAADPETPSDYTANGDYVLTFAGDAGIYTSLKADPTSDSGYQTTYFKVATGDYLYANMKLQANKIIKVSGKAIASNKTDSSKNTNLGVSLKSGSTGAVSGLPDPINFAQADGEKAFNFELTVTTEGEIVLAFTRSSGNTGCEITALTITISDAGPVDVESVSLNKTSGSLFVGATETLTATVTPSNATNKDVVWTSSDETVAAVDQNGKVTALKAGTATITATAADDETVKATCAYTVSKVMPAVITIDREEATIEIDGTIPLIAKVSPDNTTVKTVTWSSSDTSIATVDANGVVTGVSTGSVT